MTEVIIKSEEKEAMVNDFSGRLNAHIRNYAAGVWNRKPFPAERVPLGAKNGIIVFLREFRKDIPEYTALEY
jgi:hypothetical protein